MAHCLFSGSRLSVLLEEFRPQLAGLVPLISYLLWLFSPLNCSHLSPDYTLDLVIDWFINQTIETKQTKTQPWIVPALRQLLLYSSSVSLLSIVFISVSPSAPWLFLLTHFRFSCSILQPILSTVDFLSVSFLPGVSLCIPTLFHPTARLGRLANFSRFYRSCCLGFLRQFC